MNGSQVQMFSFFFKCSNCRFCFHNKMKRYLVFNLAKTNLNIFSDLNVGLPVQIYFTLLVYLLPKSF